MEQIYTFEELQRELAVLNSKSTFGLSDDEIYEICQARARISDQLQLAQGDLDV